jgi:hypothetical protein
MSHATSLLYHVCAVASRNIRFASCETSGKLTLWTRYVLLNKNDSQIVRSASVRLMLDRKKSRKRVYLMKKTYWHQYSIRSKLKEVVTSFWIFSVGWQKNNMLLFELLSIIFSLRKDINTRVGERGKERRQQLEIDILHDANTIYKKKFSLKHVANYVLYLSLSFNCNSITVVLSASPARAAHSSRRELLWNVGIHCANKNENLRTPEFNWWIQG